MSRVCTHGFSNAALTCVDCVRAWGEADVARLRLALEAAAAALDAPWSTAAQIEAAQAARYAARG